MNFRVEVSDVLIYRLLVGMYTIHDFRDKSAQCFMYWDIANNYSKNVMPVVAWHIQLKNNIVINYSLDAEISDFVNDISCMSQRRNS